MQFFEAVLVQYDPIGPLCFILRTYLCKCKRGGALSLPTFSPSCNRLQYDALYSSSQ